MARATWHSGAVVANPFLMDSARDRDLIRRDARGPKVPVASSPKGQQDHPIDAQSEELAASLRPLPHTEPLVVLTGTTGERQ